MLRENLRIALIHHWLVAQRGGEKVLEALCRSFPHADIFTLVWDPAAASETFRDRRIHTSWIQKLPRSTRHYMFYAPLFPLAVEEFDLSSYQLVISSDAAVCKGVLTRPETCHVCYCHSPLRYAWSGYQTYRDSLNGSLSRLIFSVGMHYLRQWDLAAASRVDYFVANSRNVASRIQKFYRRPAKVIYPPVDVSEYAISGDIQDYYLLAGQLVAYKRFDLAIEAFNQFPRPLWIAGDGPEYKRLKRMARGTIRFLGKISAQEWVKVLSQCRALLYPGEEDFGLVVVEAHACGRPVIALGRGGAKETVIPELNGLLYSDPDARSLVKAILDFEEKEKQFDPARIRETALRFGEERFQAEIKAYLEEKLEEFGSLHP